MCLNHNDLHLLWTGENKALGVSSSITEHENIQITTRAWEETIKCSK